MGRASRSETKTRFGKARIEDRRQDLRDGLLDHPIQDGRNTQQPLASASLWDRYPTHRLRLIRAMLKLLANLGPMRTCKRRKVLDAHPVHAGCTSIGLHPLPCPSQVHLGPRPAPSDHRARLAAWHNAGHRLPRSGSESITAPPCLLVFGPSPLGSPNRCGYYGLC